MTIAALRNSNKTPLWVSAAGAIVALALGLYAIIGGSARIEGATSVQVARLDKVAEASQGRITELEKREAAATARLAEIQKQLDRLEAQNAQILNLLVTLRAGTGRSEKAPTPAQ